MTAAAPTAPLAGIRVLDLTRLFPFSYGTQLLVDLGAEVIKVEQPGGEVGRAYVGQFAAANRGKRSVSLDLRDEAGRASLLNLAESADAIVDSFRPGFLAGMGLGFEQLRARRPNLVMCSVSGYSPDSAMASQPGHDLNYYTVAGAAIPEAGLEPSVPTIPVVDLAMGLHLAYCTAAWLLGVARGEPGGHIELSMTDLAVSLTTSSFAFDATPPAERALPYPAFVLNQVPCYRVWSTADERWITLCNLETKFWRTFLQIVGAPELEADQFAEGERGSLVVERIGALIRTRTAAEWEATFSGTEVCFSIANTTSEARTLPDFVERGLIREVDGLPEVLFPGTVDGVRPTRPLRLPAPAEDSIDLRVCTHPQRGES